MLATLTNHFFKIAVEEYLDFIENRDILKSIKRPNPEMEDPQEWDKLNSRVDQLATKIIVFSAITIESFIFDIGVTYLGEEIMANLEKLSLIEKIQVIPKLIKTIGLKERVLDKSKQWFDLLRKLIRARNSLVHSKAQSINPEKLKNPTFVNFLVDGDVHQITPEEAIQTVFLIEEEFHDYFGFNYLSSFLFLKEEELKKLKKSIKIKTMDRS